jgi:SAM-dependent methyltransferase
MTAARQQVTEALAGVERLYSDGLEQHGAAPLSVGWKDAASQRLRFAKLAELLRSGPAEPIAVNDLGCGYGALFGFLDRMELVEVSAYYGYDISIPMLEQARQTTDDRARLIHSPVPIEVADYSFASGPFNVKGECPDAAWQAHVEDAVLRLAEKSRLGFAFNLLTTFVDFRADGLFYADPCAFFRFCKQEISPDVVLLHDYPLYEWTMIVRHRRAHAPRLRA